MSCEEPGPARHGFRLRILLRTQACVQNFQGIVLYLAHTGTGMEMGQAVSPKHRDTSRSVHGYLCTEECKGKKDCSLVYVQTQTVIHEDFNILLAGLLDDTHALWRGISEIAFLTGVEIKEGETF